MKLFSNIRADLETYQGDWGCQGFWAMLIYRFGRWRYTIRPVLLRKPFSLIYRILFKVVQIITGIELPCEVPIGRNFRIDHFGCIIISGYASFGDNCIVRNNVTIGLKNLDEKTAPRIGNRVNIGAGAKVLGPITIGDNVDIGANAVVISSVPDNSIAVGIPAVVKPKRQREADKEFPGIPVVNGPCNSNGSQERLPSMILASWLAVMLAALLLTAAPDPAASAQAPAAAACIIGTNLDSITDWSTETAFSNLFKMSRRWISGTGWRQWDDSRPLDLDAQGWVRSLQPGQIARTVVLSGSRNQVPSGRYILTYLGCGKLEYNGQGVRLISSASGRDVIELNPANGMFSLFIKETDPSNYIRNIRVRQESEPEDTIFRQVFLDRLANYRVIRFMNWMATDQTRLSHWQDRPRLDDARWSINGAPVKIMAALCNRLQADPWFTLPHLADDEFVREFAMAVKQSLDPNLKIYVEHSNEVWNGQFSQAQYVREQGLRLKLHDNPFQAQMRYHARRTAEIGRIFTNILGKDRVVRVLGAWAHHHWTTTGMLQFEHTADNVDAVAVAPYFGGYLGSVKQQARVEGMSLDDLFRELQAEALPKARKEIAEQMEVVRAFKLPLIAYEGGQHLLGADPVKKNGRLNQLFDAANADPRMGELYTTYLNAWQELGGGLFVHYMNCSAMSVHGRFGALESLDQPTEAAPKFSALQSFIRQQAQR